MRQLYVDEGLPCAKVAEIVEKSRVTVQCIFRAKSAGVPEQIGHPNGAKKATVTE
jgi:hypothetical protein